MPSYTLSLKQITKKNTVIAGGKGASLGEMINAHIPVPPGFVVLSTTFDNFLKKTGLEVEIAGILDTVNIKKINTLETASEQIRALIENKIVPTDIQKEILSAFAALGARFVAVRSSATSEDGADAAWAGQLDTYLNTTKKSLLEHVQKCWASLFTPRAIFYRFEKNLHHEHISVAVVVQKMIQSDAAGIAFSVHPVTEDYNQLIIEAGLGLGEAVVSGQVTPDSYIVTKIDRVIFSKTIGKQNQKLVRSTTGGNVWQPTKTMAEKQKLSDKNILKLAATVMQLEKHYGFPVDVEWAVEKNKIFIVQSRPITTLTNTTVTVSKPKNTKKPAHTYERLYSRDFTLAQIEAWCWGESSGPRQWTLEEQPHQPALIFERTPQTVHCFVNPLSGKWTSEKLREEALQRPHFIRDITEEYLKRVAWIEPVWNNERTLNHQELARFLTELHECWSWHEAMTLALELPKKYFKKQDYAFADKIRAADRGGAGTDAVIRKSIAHIFPRLAPYATILRAQEIMDKKFPSTKELKRRLKGFYFVNNELFLDFSREDVEEKYTVSLPDTENQSGSVLKGQAAFLGIVRGQARKIFQREQVAEFKKGEIIVSPMTTPDFLPAMKKAAAFVTDEGGVTCHAAILARELKKPCVIGTKFATDVITDGDIIEVNANKGTVRIIQKK